MALTVAISGNLNINQGDTTVLTAVVTDSGGNTPSGAITYHWTTPRGSFQGATDQASATYHADFTDADDVDVIITCSVASAANPNPTVSTGSLTAMTALGITGQILNMYITETENTANGSNTILYAEGSSDSALEAGSDDDLSSDLNIYRVSWRGSTDGFVLEDNTAGNLGDFFRNNTTQSVYVVFSDGTVYEITQAMFASGGVSWSRWNLTDAGIATKFDNLGVDDTLLVGVGDAGSIGLDADTGSNTVTVRAAASMTPPPPSEDAPVIASVDAQQWTVDVPVVLDISVTNIDIDMDGHSVEVRSLFSGHYYNWNQTENRVEIRGTPESLYAEEMFTVEATNPDGTAMRSVSWSVVFGAPVIDEVGEQIVFKGADNFVFLEVRNRPQLLRTDGLWLGMVSGPQTFREKEGIAITGLVPREAEFTVDQRDVVVHAENSGGMDTYNLPLTIKDGVVTYAFTANGSVQQISIAGAQEWVATPTPPTGATTTDIETISDDSVYIHYLTTATTYTVKRVSAAGMELWSYDAGGTRSWHLYSDGTVYINKQDSNQFILRKVSADGAQLWQWTSTRSLGSVTGYNGLLDADGNYYMVGFMDSRVRVWKVSPSGTLLWTYVGLTATEGFGNRVYIGSEDGSVHLWIPSSRTVRKLSSAGVTLWNYVAPSGTYDAVYKSKSGDFYLITSTRTEGGSSTVRSLLKVSPDGELLWTLILTLTSSTTPSFSEDNEGNIYLNTSTTQNLQFRKITPVGTVRWFISQSGAFRPPIVDIVGSVYLYQVNTNLLERRTADNESLWTFTPDTLTTGATIQMILGNDGNIYLYNTSSRIMVKVFATGELGWTYTSSVVGINGNIQDVETGY